MRPTPSQFLRRCAHREKIALDHGVRAALSGSRSSRGDRVWPTAALAAEHSAEVGAPAGCPMHPYAGRARLILAARHAEHRPAARLAASTRTRKELPALLRTSHRILAQGRRLGSAPTASYPLGSPLPRSRGWRSSTPGDPDRQGRSSLPRRSCSVLQRLVGALGLEPRTR
jgi:hypothetical protein